jgi:hypothetical protein
MSTQELKMVLHESIENIDDNDFLDAVLQIIDRKYKMKTSPSLADWQVQRMDESNHQILHGQSFTNQQADLLVEKWLCE